MIIILKPGIEEKEITPIYDFLSTKNIIVQNIQGETTRMIGLAGDTSYLSEDNFLCYSCVERIMRIQEPYKLASRKFHPQDSVIDIAGQKIAEKIIAMTRDERFSHIAMMLSPAMSGNDYNDALLTLQRNERLHDRMFSLHRKESHSL